MSDPITPAAKLAAKYQPLAKQNADVVVSDGRNGTLQVKYRIGTNRFSYAYRTCKKRDLPTVLLMACTKCFALGAGGLIVKVETEGRSFSPSKSTTFAMAHFLGETRESKYASDWFNEYIAVSREITV